MMGEPRLHKRALHRLQYRHLNLASRRREKGGRPSTGHRVHALLEIMGSTIPRSRVVSSNQDPGRHRCITRRFRHSRAWLRVDRRQRGLHTRLQSQWRRPNRARLGMELGQGLSPTASNHHRHKRKHRRRSQKQHLRNEKQQGGNNQNQGGQ